MNSPVAIPAKPFPFVDPPIAVPAPPQVILPQKAEPSRQQKRRRQRRRRRIVLLVALVVVAGAGYAAYRVYFAPAATPATRYITATVGTGNIEDTVSAVGTLSASQSRSVEAPVAGTIASINVSIGAVVAVGDVIATLDLAPFQNAVTLASAQLDQSQAALANQQTQLDLAQQNLTRQQGLLAASAAAESAVQQAQAQIVQATASLQSSRTDLIQKQQALDTANANLADATITAPIAGTIVDLPVEVGQSVTVATPMMTLADLATMTVEAAASEADVGRLYVGMPAYFTTLSGSTRRWTGTLRQILPTPTVENNVVMYSLLFDVDNADGNLMIGMSTESFFVVVSANNVLTVPVGALQSARLLRTAATAGATPATTTPPATEAAAASPSEAAAASAAAPSTAATTDAAATPPAAAAAGGQGFARGQFAGGGDPAQFAQRLQEAGIDPAQAQQRFAGAQAAGGGQGFAGGGGRFQGQFAGAPAAAAAPAGTVTPTAYAVRVMQADGTIEERAVEIGAEDRVNAEVLSGLTAGETVVTSVISGTATAAGAAGGAATTERAGLAAAAGFAGGGPPAGGGAAFFGR